MSVRDRDLVDFSDTIPKSLSSKIAGRFFKEFSQSQKSFEADDRA